MELRDSFMSDDFAGRWRSTEKNVFCGKVTLAKLTEEDRENWDRAGFREEPGAFPDQLLTKELREPAGAGD
jgi:hypothetical protein